MSGWLGCRLARCARAKAVLWPLTVTVSEASSDKAKKGKVETSFAGMKTVATEFGLGDISEALQPVLRKAASDCVLN